MIIYLKPKYISVILNQVYEEIENYVELKNDC